ncbi:MAG: OmpH family outer membrane protein [Saprospiraceae bacterium]|jgi:outer membrane protein|nr:OmpH family outer membrane protein [Candidatus Parvibacillus calidus]MBX2937235.1 OmpH family outer membrane protein [Saprospiraceae bacterium]MBX7179764.1 OmpH family outer membrane protein [Saprospiraceae bacterium]MCB0592237.1 OmpH family outer membrane protein [Saprospiraceae bacterium]MCO6471673.1 OmpH family outer membrane protein [Saprospiraceae bacterium]
MITLAFGASSAIAQKVAYINSAVLMQDLPEIKQADSNLNAFQTQLQKKGEQMVTALQAKYQEIAKKQNAGEISPKQLEEESAKLKEEEAKITQFEQDMNKQVAEKRQALYQPILDKINGFIDEVAKKLGYDYVLDSSTGILLFAEDKYDITADVRHKMEESAKTPAKEETVPAPTQETAPKKSTPAKGGKK